MASRDRHLNRPSALAGDDPPYEMIIYWNDEDEAFVVEVPELPGCAADGATYEEAVATAKTVIAEWSETAQELGRPIPAPRGRLVLA